MVSGARGGAPILVPRPLRKGDLVGVVAPGSAVRRPALEAGLRALERLGLRVRLGETLFANDGFLAGSDEHRARDLVAMIEDDEVRAIHFARGGWGTSRLLDAVPWKTLARKPKLLIGYSDLTTLFAAALDRSRLSCVYGPMVAELGDRREFDRASLLRAYFRPLAALSLEVPERGVLIPGRAEGRVAGGCLTLLAHLAGTGYAPDLRGSILLIEEIGEPPYRIDRMLTQMRRAGMLDGVAGVLVGSLTECTTRGTGPSPSARRVIASFFEARRIPLVADLPFGHVRGKRSIPLGFRARIDTPRRRIVFTP